jgi:NAD(P)-dependent dehydrogenase (short-subunit alcohol dehydrogenase family)
LKEQKAMGDNIIIFGASSGLGEATAKLLESEGYNVLVSARRQEKLQLIQQKANNIFPCDVTDYESIEKSISAMVQAHGKIKSIVYCSGIQYIAPLRLNKMENVEALFKTNILGLVNVLRIFSSKRVASFNDSSLIAVSSIAGQKPEPGILAYSATKAALNNLIIGAAKEIAPIRVNGVSPGFLDTEMTQAFNNIYTDKFVEDLQNRYPLGLPTVDDVSNMISFLISSKARKITGQTIDVDGGGILI